VKSVSNVDLIDVERAAQVLRCVARRTPVLRDRLLDKAAGAEVAIKSEFLQIGGAYKFRGLFNKISSMTAGERARGIVTVSSGNAGIAAAYAALLHGSECTVVMPATASRPKVAAIKALGGRVIRHGSAPKQAFAKSLELQSLGHAFAHPFDQPEVVAGQGTVALELFEQAPSIDALIVPVGGGGLLAGTAVVLRGLDRDVELIAVQPEGAASLPQSLATGAPVAATPLDTIAEPLAVEQCGDLTFELFKDRVDDVLVVSDDDMLDAVRILWTILHVAVELAGAAGLAAVCKDRRFRNRRVGILASGGNIDVRLLAHAVDGGTASDWKREHYRS
jgi:threonine dehydratase